MSTYPYEWSKTINFKSFTYVDRYPCKHMHYVLHSHGASTVKSSLEALLTWLHKFEAVRLAL